VIMFPPPSLSNFFLCDRFPPRPSFLTGCRVSPCPWLRHPRTIPPARIFISPLPLMMHWRGAVLAFGFFVGVALCRKASNPFHLSPGGSACPRPCVQLRVHTLVSNPSLPFGFSFLFFFFFFLFFFFFFVIFFFFFFLFQTAFFPTDCRRI